MPPPARLSRLPLLACIHSRAPSYAHRGTESPPARLRPLACVHPPACLPATRVYSPAHLCLRVFACASLPARQRYERSVSSPARRLRRIEVRQHRQPYRPALLALPGIR
jgi:hypothetical protein